MAGRPDDESDGTRRTRAERDADALVDLCRPPAAARGHPKGRPGRQRPGVNLVIEAPPSPPSSSGSSASAPRPPSTTPRRASLDAGRDAGLVPGRSRPDAPQAPHRRHHPGGHDLSPALAAAFLCDATMRKVVTAGSKILEYGHAHPTLPRAIREAVVLRDRTLPVQRLSTHGRLVRGPPPPAPGPGGRRQPSANCVLLCARHHHVLHRDGWVVHPRPRRHPVGRHARRAAMAHPTTRARERAASPDRHTLGA